MIKIVLLAALIIIGTSTTTVSNIFSDPVQTNSPFIVYPKYPLGSLQIGDVITVVINMPYVSGATLSDFTVSVLDSSYTDSGITFTMPAGVTQGTIVGAGTISSNDNFFLQVYGSPTNVNIFEVDVRVNGVSRAKFADILRDRIGYYIYLAADTQIGVTVSNVAGNGNVRVAELLGKLVRGTVTDNSGTFSSGSFTVNPSITAGYRVLVPRWPSSPGPVTITYQTDSFICPFSSGFIDYHGTFKGCTFGNVHQTYVIQGHRCGLRQYLNNGTCLNVDSSCNTFNPLTGDCLTCWENSRTVTNGICSASTASINVPSCAPGTFLFQNQCISNNCSAALPNGKCTSCANSAFQLTSDGRCVEIDCSIGLYFSVALDRCAFLPFRCSVFSALTQKCTLCFPGFSPDSNGVCVSPCPAGRFFVNNNCYLLPPNCLSLSNVLHCLNCSQGYRLIQGECRLCNGPNPLFPCVTCPLDHFVNTLGQCVRVSRFCDSIDQVTGFCLTCISNLPPVNGKCCNVGQRLVDDTCIGSNLSTNPSSGGSQSQGPQNILNSSYYNFCQIFSPVTQKCTKCRNGHSFSKVPEGSDRCE